MAVLTRRVDQAQRDTLTGRYFFYVTNGENAPYIVEIAKTFSNAKAAREQAVIIASKLATDDDWEGFDIAVTDSRARHRANPDPPEAEEEPG